MISREICAFFPSATKLRQGNIFTSVCQKFCPGGVSALVDAGKHTTWQAPRRADTPAGQTIPSWTDPLPPPNGYCSGRYASYWNAFFFKFNSIIHWTIFLKQNDHQIMSIKMLSYGSIRVHGCIVQCTWTLCIANYGVLTHCTACCVN